MRMQLSFSLKKAQLPVDYRASCVSFMKNALCSYNKKFFELYYNNGAKIKSFSFSLRLPKPEFKKNEILLAGDKIEFNWSALDERDALIFYNAFLGKKNKAFELGDNNAMMLNNLVILPEHKITQSQIVIKLLSPFVVRIHDKTNNTNRYVKCSDADFPEKAKEAVAAQISMLELNTALIKGFRIENIQTKNCIVKTFHHTVDGTIGVLRLQGQPQLLDILYKAGIGANRSIGFGLFEKVY
ncbi:CRISPR-associated endoribonuclease Cas6 [Pectinatus cerevisiiphilus]|uniref:CRISPR-associated Cas6 family protein n=1 Tax=Pectinatus cerevisiiphilus TaxID=86956 RepID=A0A4R3K3H2_9FIRM|nr:CRISPR-associated endoribonuclease Cas6 [Pectinatus cerevisiiphilus]TCS77240.1 CRISPR-associated Cas6 family protein [Pectinatus cerevisiiphilus]